MTRQLFAVSLSMSILALAYAGAAEENSRERTSWLTRVFELRGGMTRDEVAKKLGKQPKLSPREELRLHWASDRLSALTIQLDFFPRARGLLPSLSFEQLPVQMQGDIVPGERLVADPETGRIWEVTRDGHLMSYRLLSPWKPAPTKKSLDAILQSEPVIQKPEPARAK